MRPRLLPLWLAILMIWPAATMLAQADFGDAPDGGDFQGIPLNFNTLDASQGPRHDDAINSTFWLARPLDPAWNRVSDEPDALIENLDNDDGNPFIFVVLIGIPAPANISVPITTTPSHNPSDDIIVNVNIDVDNDFDFDDFPDPNWVVRNRVVQQPADTTIVHTFDGFGFGNDLLLFPVWVRMTLTSTPVPLGWNDGSAPNAYTDGETEDHFVAFHKTGPYPDTWNNPPNDTTGDPDVDTMPPTPRRGPAQKSAKLRYPKVVYVKCDETKCFYVEMENTGDTAITDVRVDFQFAQGTPLPSAPTVVSKAEIPPNGDADDLEDRGDKMRFKVCVTGWPCTSPPIESRWARYKIKMQFDPDGLWYEQEFDLDFGNDEDPFQAGRQRLALEPLDTLDDHTVWEGEIGQFFEQSLLTWTGVNPFLGRWINDTPALEPIHVPAWATLTDSVINADSVIYTLSGTPGTLDNGRDSLVVEVRSRDDLDSNNVRFVRHTEIIDIANVNNPPVLAALKADYTACVNLGESFDIPVTATDADITSGKRDTIILDHYLTDESGNLVSPGGTLSFTDDGDGTGRFEWTPALADEGLYTLHVVAWDYYFDIDQKATDLEVAVCGSIDDLDDLTRPVLVQNQPNPFMGTTQITVGLPDRTDAIVEVLSADGKRVAVLMDGPQDPGVRTLTWDARHLPDGIYLFRLTVDGETFVRTGVKAE